MTLCHQMSASRRIDDRSVYLEGSPTGPRRRMTCTALPLEIHKTATTCPTQSHIPEVPDRQQLPMPTRNLRTYTCICSSQCKVPHVTTQCIQGVLKTAQDICNIYLTNAERPSTVSRSAAVSHRHYIPQRLTSTDRSISKGT